MTTTGTTFCGKCLRVFTKDTPVCCSHLSFDDGSHEDGLCVDCCKHEQTWKPQDGQSTGGGTYERGE